MNKGDSLSLIQGPSTVTCRIVNYLLQLTHWLHQLPTVGTSSLLQLTKLLTNNSYNMKSNQVINLMLPWLEAMETLKMTYLLFISSHRFLKLRVISLNQQKLKTKKFKLQSKHSINQNIQAFRSTRLILVQRVEKSNDGNKSRELLSTSDLKRFRSFVTPTALL
jgi:hypothetical protein